MVEKVKFDLIKAKPDRKVCPYKINSKLFLIKQTPIGFHTDNKIDKIICKVFTFTI